MLALKASQSRLRLVGKLTPIGPPVAWYGDACILGVVLGAQEIRQEIRVRPAWIARSGPIVEILGRPAEIGHAVDRSRAADHATARQGHASAIEVLLRHRRQTPPELGAHDRRADGGRDLDERVTVGATGFDQTNAIRRVLRQAAREHASGGPGADDDVVELAIELGRFAAQAGPPKGLSLSLGASAVALARAPYVRSACATV